MKNKIKELIKVFEHNYLYIVEFLFFIILNFFFAYNISSIRISTINLTFVISFITTILLETFFFVYFIKKKETKIEKVFLLIILVIGPLYLVLFPFNSLPDDATHIMRTYEISEGHLTSKKYDNNVVGRDLDDNISKYLLSNKNYSYELKHLNLKNGKKKVVQNFANTSLYSFICYLPQTIGVVIAKIFSFSIPFQLFLGRLFNFLTFVFVMYYAIKFIPIKKEILFFVSLLPITLQGAISMSPDALTIAMSSFLVAYVLSLKKDGKKQIKNSQIILLALTSLILSQCKIVYLPICLILFLIPKEKFESLKKKNMIIISILVFITIVSLMWLSIASKNLPNYSNGGINSSLQLSGIIKNPIRFFNVLFLTTNNEILNWILGAFGKNLGCFSINISDILVIANFILFILIGVFNYNDKYKMKKIDRILYLFIFISVVALMLSSLYLQWTPVGNSTIIGVQGRYFIPILIFFVLIVFNNKIKIKFNMLNKYFYLFIVLENICVLNYIFWTFI